MDTTPTGLPTEAERRSIVIGVLLAMLLAALDQTIVAPALPTIGKALGDVAYLPWVVSAFFLTATAVTPLYGKLADIHGRRPVLFTAIGIFVAGSVLCALAPNMFALILGRAFQGLGGGGLMALAQTVIGDIVPPRERGRYTVYISATWATASIAGPIVGGFFAQNLHWSLIFWINLPLAGVAVLMTNRSLKRLPRMHRPHSLDYIGAVLMMCATVCIMLLLTWGGSSYAWLSPQILGLAGGFLLLGGVFAWHVLNVEEPLIPLPVLRNRIVALATFGVFFAMGNNIGLSVYVPLYLELVHGVGSAGAGLSLVAFLVASVVGANIVGYSMQFVQHYKRWTVAGLAIAIVGNAVLAWNAATLSLPMVEFLLCVVGFGLGTQFPVATVCVQNAVSPHDLGVATGMLSFLRSLGSALGVCILGAILLSAGVIHDLGGMGEASFDPTKTAAAGHAFSLVFGAATVSLVLCLICFLGFEELPLRGRAPVMSEP